LESKMNSSSSTVSTSTRYVAALTLAFLMLGAISLIRNPTPSLSLSNDAATDAAKAPSQSTPSVQDETTMKTKKTRTAVGGYSPINVQQFLTLKFLANFAVSELALGNASGSVGTANLETWKIAPEELDENSLGGEQDVVEGEAEDLGGKIAVDVVILDAYRQVVAGMNYKLTLGLFRTIPDDDNSSSNGGSNGNKTCLGGFQVTIYDQFGKWSVTSWGKTLTCEEVSNAMTDIDMNMNTYLNLNENDEEESDAIGVDAREDKEEVADEPDNS